MMRGQSDGSPLMTNPEMQAALADMLEQWQRAKHVAAQAHPEWSQQQIEQAVANAFTAELQRLA